MEDLKKITDFLTVSVSGKGDGSGYGDDYGNGDGSGYGDDYGNGSGSGDGSGRGDGSDYGYGDGSGYGRGRGYGRGDGGGIKSFCGEPVYLIDETPTIIKQVHGSVAKGWILRKDLTLTPCCVVKQGGYFAHGVTLREAMDVLRDKLFEGMPEEERIQAFVEAHPWGGSYSTSDLNDWHHRLTGSCEMGRKTFAADHGIPISESEKMTVEAFIRLTKNAYGWDVIKKLAEAYKGLGVSK